MNETVYSQLGNVKTASPPPNFADTVGLASERVMTLVKRLEEVTSRLCGAVPQEASGGPTAVPNGLLSEVMERASNIAQRADAGLDMINRIERALP